MLTPRKKNKNQKRQQGKGGASTCSVTCSLVAPGHQPGASQPHPSRCSTPTEQRSPCSSGQRRAPHRPRTTLHRCLHPISHCPLCKSHRIAHLSTGRSHSDRPSTRQRGVIAPSQFSFSPGARCALRTDAGAARPQKETVRRGARAHALPRSTRAAPLWAPLGARAPKRPPNAPERPQTAPNRPPELLAVRTQCVEFLAFPGRSDTNPQPLASAHTP